MVKPRRVVASLAAKLEHSRSTSTSPPGDAAERARQPIGGDAAADASHVLRAHALHRGPGGRLARPVDTALGPVQQLRPAPSGDRNDADGAPVAACVQEGALEVLLVDDARSRGGDVEHRDLDRVGRLVRQPAPPGLGGIRPVRLAEPGDEDAREHHQAVLDGAAASAAGPRSASGRRSASTRAASCAGRSAAGPAGRRCASRRSSRSPARRRRAPACSWSCSPARPPRARESAPPTARSGTATSLPSRSSLSISSMIASMSAFISRIAADSIIFSSSPQLPEAVSVGSKTTSGSGRSESQAVNVRSRLRAIKGRMAPPARSTATRRREDWQPSCRSRRAPALAERTDRRVAAPPDTGVGAKESSVGGQFFAAVARPGDPWSYGRSSTPIATIVRE